MFIPRLPVTKPSGFQSNKESLKSGSCSVAEKLYECPGCGLQTCYYLGIHDIECANSKCRFYKKPLKKGEKRYHTGWEMPYTEEKDVSKEQDNFDFSDLDIGFGD
jgi:hypothetical protein